MVGEDFAEGFANGFFDDGERLLFLVHVIESNQEIRWYSAIFFRCQDVLVQAKSFAHESSQMISFDGSFEERFGSPNKYLCILFSRLVCHAKRPRSEAFALFV